MIMQTAVDLAGDWLKLLPSVEGVVAKANRWAIRTGDAAIG